MADNIWCNVETPPPPFGVLPHACGAREKFLSLIAKRWGSTAEGGEGVFPHTHFLSMTLTANNLACERNGRVVFSNLSFEVKPGQCVELRGANGAGKSSLLRLIAGLVPKTAGIFHLGADEEIAQKLHFIAHADAMKTAMTVRENLVFWSGVLGGHTIEPALAAFRLQGLQHDGVQLLSAGQRRRLALSRLFLAERPLWLLDEPMTALDATSQDELRAHIKIHLTSGGIVLAATHGDLGITPDQTITLEKP
jgi:heme exporter protein A